MTSDRRHRRPARPDEGFTLVELAVSLGLLALAGAMAATLLLTINRVSNEVANRSGTLTELRTLLDDTFEQLATARGQITCSDPVSATTIAACRRVRELGTPILSATATQICFLSRRPAPTTLTAGLTSTPWKICLTQNSSDQTLVLTRFAPVGEINPTYNPTATSSQALGRSLAAAPLTYRGTDGATMTPTSTTLDQIALVSLQTEIQFRDRNGQSVNQSLGMTAGLRALRYGAEGDWTGDKRLVP